MKPSIEESLSRVFPKISKQWDLDRNFPLKPTEVLPGSGRKVWWKCALGHSTKSEVRVRVKCGCGVCANRQVLAGFNDLKSQFPEVSAEWNYSKNNDLDPSEVPYGARQSANWICEQGHEWNVSISSRTNKGSHCPYCMNLRIWPGEGDVNSLFPNLAMELDVDKNPEMPGDLSPSSKEQFYWKCKLGHGYKASVGSRTGGSGCPFCARKKVLPGFNDLQTEYPEIAEKWDLQKNSKKSREVISGSHAKAFWICPLGHNYESVIRSQVRGSGCNICSGNVIIAGFNDFASAEPEISLEWDYAKNGDVLPTQISKWNESKYWWICPEGHSYSATPSNRHIGRGCAVCYNRQIQVGVNDLATVFPDLVTEWDYLKNKSLGPTNLVQGTHAKAWWLCSEGHSYLTAISSRTSFGVGCPECANTGYSTVTAGILYFIKHPQLRAAKIGITNIDNRHDRIDNFAKLGWQTIQTWEDENGFVILGAETLLFRWIRKDLKLPVFLKPKEMGRHGGWSETFSLEAVAEDFVVAMIEKTLSLVRNEQTDSR